MPAQIQVDSQFKDIAGLSAKVNGEWKSISEGYTKVDGAWKQWFSPSSFYFEAFGSSETDRANNILVNSDNSFYIVGESAGAVVDNFGILIAKFSSAGLIQWQRVINGDEGFRDIGFGVATDSSDNVYIVGYAESDGAGDRDGILVSYDSFGALRFQKTLGGTQADEFYSIAIDSSDNIYIAGISNSTGFGFRDALIAKYDTSGDLVWSRVLAGTGGDVAAGIAIDSNDDIYFAGQTLSGGAGGDDVLIAKYNSSGVIQWQRTLGDADDQGATSIAIDGSDNIYLAGLTEAPVGSNFLLAKYDTSGNLTWQKELGGSVSETGRGVKTDSSGNVYIVGETDSEGEGFDDILVAKYDSAGVIQWQRLIGGSPGDDQGNNISFSTQDYMVIAGFSRNIGVGGTDAFMAKLPNDGSLTGTYTLGGTVVYQAATLTDSTPTLTSAESTLTDSAVSLTEATSTLDNITTTFTKLITRI